MVVLILVFAAAARTPLDSDMWWHLRAGQETWRTGRPMTTDFFSYTRQSDVWINHSWLSQVGMYLVFRGAGFLGLSMAVALLATASMGLVYVQMEGQALLRAFTIVLTISVAGVAWSPRPQLVSLVMFGVVGYLLYLYKWRSINLLWMSAPIFVLWSNLHGGYVLGLLLIGTMIAGEVLNHALGCRGEEILSLRRIKVLLLWMVLSGLVVVINPNGLAMWTIPFRTVRVSVLQEFISEWASPDFHQIFQQSFLWLLLATFGVAGVSSRRLDGSDLASVAGFAYLALLARRNFGPFAMVASPVLARHLNVTIKDWHDQVGSHLERWAQSIAVYRKFMQTEPVSQSMNRVFNASIIALLLFVSGVKLSWVTSPAMIAGFEENIYPMRAVEWIKANQPIGRIFNDYNWGGYLIWHLRDYPVFVDGRTDLFDDELLNEYLRIIAGGVGYQEQLDSYKVNIVLVRRDSGLAEEIARNGAWVMAYQGGRAVVYVRKGS